MTRYEIEGPWLGEMSRRSTPYHIVQRRRRVAKWWCAIAAAVVILAVCAGVA